MGAIKMTFSLPEDLARRFLRQVPSRERSKYVSEALSARLRRQQAGLIRACQLANEDPEVAAVEAEMNALNDRIEEPWDESPAR